jgi:hypothetical protein
MRLGWLARAAFVFHRREPVPKVKESGAGRGASTPQSDPLRGSFFSAQHDRESTFTEESACFPGALPRKPCLPHVSHSKPGAAIFPSAPLTLIITTGPVCARDDFDFF